MLTYIYIGNWRLLLVLNQTKQTIKENKEIKFKRNIKRVEAQAKIWFSYVKRKNSILFILSWFVSVTGLERHPVLCFPHFDFCGVNLSHAKGFFLYPLKTPENQWFDWILVWTGLNSPESHFDYNAGILSGM